MSKDEKLIHERQFSILRLIGELLKYLFRYGNKKVYYHVPGRTINNQYHFPLEVEGIEIRKREETGYSEDTITIY